LKIIYNCFGGSHSSVTAAAIHLQLLPDTHEATNEQLLSLPYYDAQVAFDHGRIRYMGRDEVGNEIYITSKRGLGSKYTIIMSSILELIANKDEQAVFIDTMPYVNIWMMIGGFLSRRWGFTNLGRRIVLYGTRQSYFRFIQLVYLVKQGLQ
jgi:hypothetical protein